MNWHQLGATLVIVAALTSILVVFAYLAFRNAIGAGTLLVSWILAGTLVVALDTKLFDWLGNWWSETSSTAGRFSASFPCAAEASESVVDAGPDSVVGPVTEHYVKCESKLTERFYSVSSIALPDKVPVNEKNIQTVLDSSVAAMAGRPDTTILRTADMPFYGHPARELEFTMDGFAATARIVVANRHTYRLLVVERPNSSPDSKERFFDSFRLTR